MTLKTILFHSFLLTAFWAYSNAFVDEQQQIDSLNAVMESAKDDQQKIEAAIRKAEILEKSNLKEAKAAAQWALQLSKKKGYKKGMFDAWYALASMHFESKEPRIMLLYIDSMQALNIPDIETIRLAEMYNLSGKAHYDLAELIEALEAWEKAWELYSLEERAGVLSNIGNIYLSSDQFIKAREYFIQAADINHKEDKHDFLTNNYINLSKCYPKGDSLKLFYLNKAEYHARAINYLRLLPFIYDEKTIYYSVVFNFRAATYCMDSLRMFALMDPEESVQSLRINALNYYRYSLAKYKLQHSDTLLPSVAEGSRSSSELFDLAGAYFDMYVDEIPDLRSKVFVYAMLADIQLNLKDYETAARYYKLSLDMKDSLNSNQAQFLLADIERKERAKQRIEAEKIMELKKKEERIRKTIMRMGGLFFLLLVFFLWFRLNYVRKSKKALQIEKDRSESLLLNILPEEIAEELKEFGKAKAQSFDLATIIFTDFKDFTQTSEKLTPEELVEEINGCFKGFDMIMEKYNVEKIKTIGDAYMAAGGVPVPSPDSVKQTILAALEMQRFISSRKDINKDKGIAAFEMRVGVHTGPVVAGIVGIKKFQYDIWGDTVNTASRVESNGEVGKVNITEATYELIKDDKDFVFESRGNILAKGKGELRMYFVELKK